MAARDFGWRSASALRKTRRIHEREGHGLSRFPKIVILSAAATSRSEVTAESKDPCMLLVPHGCRREFSHARSRPIVSFCPEIFLLCFSTTVLIFFIAGLLYLLCFEHVDNLGAYSIPSETGLLIPFDYNNFVRQ
jgi:hypothetical protein